MTFPAEIFITPEARDKVITRRVLSEASKLSPEVRIRRIDSWKELAGLSKLDPDPVQSAKERLLLVKMPGTMSRKCPGSPGVICCNYRVLDLVQNCPFDCAYCFLQDYLNVPAIVVACDLEAMFVDVDRQIEAAGGRTVRFGTGEMGDSLALDHLTDTARELVQFFAGRPQAVLELKTKSDRVERLAGLEHRGRTVISWSLNPPSVIAAEERGTASLDARLEAARKCANWGYRIGFHFDPIIHQPGWEGKYVELVAQLLKAVPSNQIAWISLGGFRYLPAFKAVAEKRFPRTSLFLGELLPCPDGKIRYLKHIRISIYRKLAALFSERAPGVRLYLCMERAEVWRRVFDKLPDFRDPDDEIFICS